MRKLVGLLFVLIIALPTLARAQSYNALSYTAGSFNSAGCGGTGGVCFADLATLPVGLNGTITYCKDCEQTNPCQGTGTGAMAMMVAGAWHCTTGTVNTPQCGNPGTPCNVSTLNATAINLSGPMLGASPLATLDRISVNGALNVQAYGAKGDGTTDDTAAIQSAATAASGKSPIPCVYFPHGKYLVTSDLNFTSSTGQPFCIEGDDPSNTQILCIPPTTGSTMNCLDASGSDGYSIRNISLYGGSSANGIVGTHAPKVLLLLARASNNNGFGHTLENVWTANTGAHTIYNYGAELAQWRQVRSNGQNVYISGCNNDNVTSRFTTLVPPPTSMSVVTITGGNFATGGGVNNCAITLDTSCPNAGIHDIHIWGIFLGEMSGGATGICDTPGTGSSHVIMGQISIIGTRMEASDNSSNYRFASFNSYINQLTMLNDNLGQTGQLAQAPLYFGDCVDNSSIDLQEQGGGFAPGVKFIEQPGNGCARGSRFYNYPKSMLPLGIAWGDLAGGATPIGDTGNLIQWWDSAPPYMGHLDAGGSEANAVGQVIPGSTAGSVDWSMPVHGVQYKVVAMYFSGYQNNSATPQWITYPVVFNAAPVAIGSCPTGMNYTDGHLVYLPASMAAPYTGQCMLAGM